MSQSKLTEFNILPEYQDIVINGLNIFQQEIKDIAEKYRRVNVDNQTKKRDILWVSYGIILNLFSMNVNNITRLFSTDEALLLKKYFLAISNPLPARCRSYDQINKIKERCSNDFNTLSYKFIDYFYTTIGERNRNDFKVIFHATRDKITPPEQIFFGLILPTKILPNLDPYELGEIMPYFNAKVYQHINLISNMSQLHGKLKELKRVDGHYWFELAGKLGFIVKPPTYHRLRFFFQKLSFILRKTGK